MGPKSVVEWTREDYERAAQEYLESLPPEHFMESPAQAGQRKITLASLGLVEVRRQGFHLCNELLIQYLIQGNGNGTAEELGRVVPDNMVVLLDGPLPSMSSFNAVFESAKIFWVLEYASRSNRRKDYEDNFRRYGQDLKIPYYLLFDADLQTLQLHRHNGVGYDKVPPNEAGRLALPEVEIEVALVEGWVRFWYRGELVPLPGELLEETRKLRRELELAKQRADEAEAAAKMASERATEAENAVKKASERATEAENAAKKASERVTEVENTAKKERERAESAEAENLRLRLLLQQAQGGGSTPA